MRVFLGVCLTLTSAHALSEKSYFVGKEIVTLVDSEAGDRVSKPCLKKTCTAQEALKAIRLPSEFHSVGGPNPGSVLCRTQTQTQVVIARDPQGGEQSLCRFKDGSFVSSASLYRRAILNGATR